MTESLFLKNLWYFAMHGSFLVKGKLVGKEILGERIVFGRDENKISNKVHFFLVVFESDF